MDKYLPRSATSHISKGLIGSIPPEFGQLGVLLYLDLSGNQLSGSIPSELGNLHGAKGLFLSKNQLTGELPASFNGLWNLWQLDVSHNQLTGRVPGELASTGLDILKVNDNYLTGPLPSTLTALDLSYQSTYREGTLWFDQTDLCEPPDSSFQTWLLIIPHMQGTDMTCGAQTVVGLVWNDANRNGTQDSGEQGLEGATVTLTHTLNTASVDAVGRRVFTDAGGHYRFDYVATGPHAITVAKPGHLPTSGATVTINVPAEGSVTVPPVGIAWAVWQRIQDRC